jgi:hypothetical protein
MLCKNLLHNPKKWKLDGKFGRIFCGKPWLKKGCFASDHIISIVGAFDAVRNATENFIVILYSVQTVFCSETQVLGMKESAREKETR